MPNPYITNNRKSPISGPKAYIDGGEKNKSSFAQKVEKAKSYTPTISRPAGSGSLASAIKDKKNRHQASAAPASGGTVIGGTTQAPETEVSSSYTGSSYSGGVSDLSDYLRQQQAAATEAALAGLKGAYEKNARLYDDQRRQLAPMYAAQRNALAADVAQRRRDYDERALASGLNTGTAGQADLARSSVLTQGMANIGEAEADALAQIDLARSQLQAEYENAIAQQKAEDSAALMKMLYEEAVRVQNARMAEAQAAARSYSAGGSGSGGRGGRGSGGGSATQMGAYPGKTGRAFNINLVHVPGYGEVSYNDAETLEKNGYIKLRGVDKNGEPVFAKTTKKNYTNPIRMTR